MIVRNEERFLARCLDSVKDVVDEMIVVDTGSTDRTVEIAESYGATVLHRKWRDDFAWARNQALEAATKRWILALDADEELVPESKPALGQLKDVPADQTAVWVRIYNRSDDYRGTGDMSHALTRIFPNDSAIRYKGLIHEFPTIGESRDGLKAVTSPIGVVHHGYVKEVVHAREKGARNLAMVRAATEREPHDPFHWFNLGTTAFLVGDYELARDALERMRQMTAHELRGFMPNGLAVLAETYCDKLGDPVAGEGVARATLAIAPHYANAHFQLGKALVAQSRFDDAREAFRAAIDDGKFAGQQFVVDDQVYVWKAHSEIGSTYVMQKDDASALEWFDKGLKNAPKAEPLHINRARALERLGRLEEAGEAYRAVYELHRSEHSAADYVNFLLRRHREQEALRVVDESHSSCSPDFAVPLLLAAAAVAQRLGSSDDERYLRSALQLRPGSAEILNPLEGLLRERGRSNEIPELLAREDETRATVPADFLRRARRAFQTDRFEDAREFATSGLALAPEDPSLLFALAAARTRLGDSDCALEVLDRITECNSELMLSVVLLRAGILRNAGRFAESLECTRRALELDPRNAEAARIGLELSAEFLRTQRFSEAAAVAELVLQTQAPG